MATEEIVVTLAEQKNRWVGGIVLIGTPDSENEYLLFLHEDGEFYPDRPNAKVFRSAKKAWYAVAKELENR